MKKISIAIYIFAVILIFSATIAKAAEPTWLFTIPKAQSMGKDNFDIGFIYADFGATENLELGIHGLKYSVPASDLAFGISLFPMASPYVVISPGSESARFHLGLKAAPYIFFAGLEVPVSPNIKFIAELNNGLSAGVRLFPARNWTLDIFAAFASIEVYKYKYKRIEIEDFHIVPGILFAYSGKLQ